MWNHRKDETTLANLQDTIKNHKEIKINQPETLAKRWADGGKFGKAWKARERLGCWGEAGKLGRGWEVWWRLQSIIPA